MTTRDPVRTERQAVEALEVVVKSHLRLALVAGVLFAVAGQGCGAGYEGLCNFLADCARQSSGITLECLGTFTCKGDKEMEACLRGCRRYTSRSFMSCAADFSRVYDGKKSCGDAYLEYASKNCASGGKSTSEGRLCRSKCPGELSSCRRKCDSRGDRSKCLDCNEDCFDKYVNCRSDCPD